jgi:hypothetical protein
MRMGVEKHFVQIVKGVHETRVRSGNNSMRDTNEFFMLFGAKVHRIAVPQVVSYDEGMNLKVW